MYTARISTTDPHAFPSLGAVLRDSRYTNTDLYLHVEPGRYTEPRALEITTRVMVVPVGGPGTVEVSVSAADSVFVVKGARGALELYGVNVRGGEDAPDSPPIRADRGTRFKAVDSVFTSGTEIEVSGDGTEVDNCRFDGCGLFWKRGTGGFVRDTVFRGAALLFWRAVDPTVSGVRFSDHDKSAVVVSESSVAVTDCVVTDVGKPDGSAVFVKDGADATFTDLSISAGRGRAVVVSGEGTRASLTSCRIDNPGDWAVAAANATVTADGLTVQNTRAPGVYLLGSRFTGRGLVFERLGSVAVAGSQSRIELSDVEIRDARRGTGLCGRGVYLSKGRLEADGIRASDLDGDLVSATDAEVSLASVRAERVRGVLRAKENSTLTVRGLEAVDSEQYVLAAEEGATVRVSDSLLTGGTSEPVHSRGADVTLVSVTVSGSGAVGAVVEDGGLITLDDTVLRDGRGVGLRVRDTTSRARLVRSRITGNAGAGVHAPPDADVEMCDVMLRDNGEGDHVSLREERTAG